MSAESELRRWTPTGSRFIDLTVSIDALVASRTPMSEPGASGARLSRIALSDGTVLIEKEISPDWDWMMPATADTGRAAELWVSGAMQRCPPTVDPAIERIEETPNGWRIYMRDVDAHFLRGSTIVSRAEARHVLSALADLHRAFWNEPPAGAARLEDLLTLVAPRTVDRYVPQSSGFAGVVRRGWEVFADIAPADVREGVEHVIAEPGPLANALRDDGVTLTHSDPHYGNVAPLGDRLVFLDWSLAAAAPPAIDFVWFLDQSLRFIDATPGELAADFAEFEGDLFQRRTLELAYFAELVLSAWQYAGMVDSASGDERAERRATFEWWVDAARQGLEALP